jgi:hypothetical protein
VLSTGCRILAKLFLERRFDDPVARAVALNHSARRSGPVSRRQTGSDQQATTVPLFPCELC